MAYQPYPIGNKTNIKTNATTVVKASPGTLFSIVINNPGSGWTVQIFDNTSATGTLIGTATSLSALSGPLNYNLTTTTGLTIVTAGTTPGDITVVWS